jgi:DNA polymerase III alpha subunit
MKYNRFGELYVTNDDLIGILYQQPDIDLAKFMVVDPGQYNQSREHTHSHNLPILKRYVPVDYKEDVPLELFDSIQQSKWTMPEEYKKLDIAKLVLDLCKTQQELQRVGKELLLYQERDLFDLLRQLKYVIDTWRSNNIVWGVGRGSSVASYVLYLLGVHKINSIYYDLDIEEFLR